MQEILVFIFFLTAVIYLIRYFYRTNTSKGCAAGCGSCGKIDVEKIIAQHQKAEYNKQQSHGNQ